MWNKTMVTVYLKSISLYSEFDERDREKMNSKKQPFFLLKTHRFRYFYNFNKNNEYNIKPFILTIGVAVEHQSPILWGKKEKKKCNWGFRLIRERCKTADGLTLNKDLSL